MRNITKPLPPYASAHHIDSHLTYPTADRPNGCEARGYFRNSQWHCRTKSNIAHTFVSLLRAVSMIQESPSSRPLAASAQDSPSIPSSPELTSGLSVSTASTSSATSTTTISSTVPYDSKFWVVSIWGRTWCSLNLAPAHHPTLPLRFPRRHSPTMPRALSPTLSSVDRPQQHQQAQQQQDRATTATTTSGEIFPCSGYPSRTTTLHIISTTYLNCRILLFLFPPLPSFPRIMPLNLFRLRRKGCCGPRRSDKVIELLPRI